MTKTNQVEQKVLQVLAEIQPAPIKEICDATNLSKTTVYDSLTRLELKQMVVKTFTTQKKRGRPIAEYELLLVKKVDHEPTVVKFEDLKYKNLKEIDSPFYIQIKQILDYLKEKEDQGASLEAIVQHTRLGKQTTKKLLELLEVDELIDCIDLETNHSYYFLCEFTNNAEERIMNEVIEILEKSKEEGVLLQNILTKITSNPYLVKYYISMLKEEDLVDYSVLNRIAKIILTRYKEQALSTLAELREEKIKKNLIEIPCPSCKEEGLYNLFCSEFFCEKCKKTGRVVNQQNKQLKKPKRKKSTPRILIESFKRELYKFIVSDFGLSISTIANHFNKPHTTLLWHLQMLERENYLRSFRFMGKKIFYPYVLSSEDIERAYVALQHSKAEMLLVYIIDNPGINQTELAKYFTPKLHLDTARYHLQKLKKAGLIRSKSKGINRQNYAIGLAQKMKERSLVEFSDPYIDFLQVKLKQQRLKIKIIIKKKNHLKLELNRPYKKVFILDLQINDSILEKIPEN